MIDITNKSDVINLRSELKVTMLISNCRNGGIFKTALWTTERLELLFIQLNCVNPNKVDLSKTDLGLNNVRSVSFTIQNVKT